MADKAKTTEEKTNESRPEFVRWFPLEEYRGDFHDSNRRWDVCPSCGCQHSKVLRVYEWTEVRPLSDPPVYAVEPVAMGQDTLRECLHCGHQFRTPDVAYRLPGAQGIVSPRRQLISPPAFARLSQTYPQARDATGFRQPVRQEWTGGQSLSVVAGIPLLITSVEQRIAAEGKVTLIEAWDKKGQGYFLGIKDGFLQNALARAWWVNQPVCATFIFHGGKWTVGDENCESLFTKEFTGKEVLLNLADLVPGDGETRTLSRVAGTPLRIDSIKHLYVGRYAIFVSAIDGGGKKHFLVIEDDILRSAVLRAELAGLLVCTTFIFRDGKWTVDDKDCKSLFEEEVLLNLADLMPKLGEIRTLREVEGKPLIITSIQQLYVGGSATLVRGIDMEGRERILLIESSDLKTTLANVVKTGLPARVAFFLHENRWIVGRN